jgi:hypothetical protein
MSERPSDLRHSLASIAVSGGDSRQGARASSIPNYRALRPSEREIRAVAVTDRTLAVRLSSRGGDRWGDGDPPASWSSPG